MRAINQMFITVNMKYWVILLMLSVGIVACKTTKSTTSKKKHTSTQPVTLNAAQQQQVDMLFVDGCVDMMVDNVESAIEQFLQVLRIDPNHHTALYCLAKIYVENPKLKKADEAVRVGEAALKGNPENYWYYDVLVSAYLNLGDYPNAIRLQKIVTQKFPKQRGVWKTLLEFYEKTNDPQAALATVKEMETKVGINEDSQIEKFKILVQLNQFEEALTVINKLLELNKEKPEVYYNKYKILMKLNREEEGIALMESMLEQFPNDNFALRTLAEYYKNKGNFKASDEYLFRLFSLQETPLERKIETVNAMIKLLPSNPSLDSKVLQIMKILYDVHPNEAAVYELNGDYYTAKGNYKEARKAYAIAVEKDVTIDKVWEKLLVSGFKANDAVALHKDATEALELYPNNDRFSFFLGMADLGLQHFEDAIEAFERVKKRGVQSQEIMKQVYMGLATAYFKTQNDNEADANYAKALSLTPDDIQTLNTYAYFLAIRKIKMEKALEMAQKALSLAPNNADCLDTHGYVLYQMGDYEKALLSAQKAVEVKTNAETLEHLGDILFKLGRVEDAKNKWLQAKNSGNPSINIDEKLKK